jgi:hypothetical protein
MGREIRRVAKGWKHPRDDRGEFIPLMDEDYESAFDSWREDGALEELKPDPSHYRSEKWEEKDLVCFQAYETVSEGTPITPVFDSKEKLLEYLITHGTFWSSKPWLIKDATLFIEKEWLPSAMTTSDGDMWFCPDNQVIEEVDHE